MVETFIIEETEELIHDNEQLEKWNQYIEELSLVGQKQIFQPEKSPVPFMFMNAGITRVFEVLCPTKVDVEKYDKTPIPVEILGLVSLSKREGYFTKIQIWYDDKTPDPVCVGVIEGLRTYGDGSTSSYKTILSQYLLGRWADVKADFEELKVRAFNRFKAQTTEDLENRIADAQASLMRINSICTKHMQGDYSPF